jgi:hypothetical protein
MSELVKCCKCGDGGCGCLGHTNHQGVMKTYCCVCFTRSEIRMREYPTFSRDDFCPVCFDKKCCVNCQFGDDGGIYIFCREPERMKYHSLAYEKGQVPQGGYPQSFNYVCKSFRKHL